MVIGVVGIVTSSVSAGLLILVVNGIYLYNKFKSYFADVTSISFFNIITNLNRILPIKNKIFVLIQLLILIFVSVFFVIYSKKKKKKPVLTKAVFSAEFRNNESRTDLDMLYRLLIKRKELGLGDIEQLFKVNNDVALDWCKVLENAELALIDYPSFQKPVLRLPENEETSKKLGENQVTKVVIDKTTGKKKIIVVNKTPGETNTTVKKNATNATRTKKIPTVKRNSTKVIRRKSTPVARKTSTQKKTKIIKKPIPKTKINTKKKYSCKKEVPK